VQALHIALSRDLILGESTGDSFGTLLQVDADSKGNIFVGDWMNAMVWVFGPDGRRLTTLGRRGQGPGEFRAVHQVEVGRGDSVYVFDGNSYRLTVYSPSPEWKLAYTIRVTPAQDVPLHFFVPSDPADGFLFTFKNSAAGTLSVHRVDETGSLDPRQLLMGQATETAVKHTGTSVVKTAPLYRRRALVGLTSDDQLYYGWSENISLTFYDLDGKELSIYRANAEPLPVTSRDISYELRDASKLRREALKSVEPPATKPAVETILIDDRSWIWMDRYSADPTVSEWWVSVRENGVGNARFTLPDEIKLQTIRDGHAYGASVDDEGFPTVVRFAIDARRVP